MTQESKNVQSAATHYLTYLYVNTIYPELEVGWIPYLKQNELAN